MKGKTDINFLAVGVDVTGGPLRIVGLRAGSVDEAKKQFLKVVAYEAASIHINSDKDASLLNVMFPTDVSQLKDETRTFTCGRTMEYLPICAAEIYDEDMVFVEYQLIRIGDIPVVQNTKDAENVFRPDGCYDNEYSAFLAWHNAVQIVTHCNGTTALIPGESFYAEKSAEASE